MRSYFNEHSKEFVRSERFTITRVSLAGQTPDSVREGLTKGASASGINSNGGSARVLTVTREDVPPKAWTALHLALNGAKITDPVKLGGGAYLLRIDRYQPEEPQTFEQAKSKIIERLAPAQRRLAIQALGQALRGQRDVEVHLENLD
jgi:hypothetical protein